MEGTNEIELIKGCLNNDSKYQTELFNKYKNKAFLVCLKFAKTTIDAEDMLMEGFFNIFKSLPTYDWKCPFSGWLQKVIRNTAVSFYRSTKRFHNEYPIDDFGDMFTDNHHCILSELNRQTLIQIIDKLPNTSRMIFTMKAIDGYSFDEIASITNKKSGAVRVAYLRARRIIQKEILKENVN